tara:strand:+ start:1637 stop:2164 length:528 start_codon:yes stop_codon:yes gene_type:complete
MYLKITATYLLMRDTIEIAGFEHYEVYPDGIVYSIKRRKFLSERECSSGYYQVALHGSNGREDFLIHRLVALNFIPNPENKPHVDHINRDRKDNRVENLRWVSQLENAQNHSELPRPDNRSCLHRNISRHRDNGWVFQKTIWGGQKHTKFFKKLDDAIAYKETYLRDYIKFNQVM